MAVTATGTRPWQHLNLKISADTATGDRTVTSLDGTKQLQTENRTESSKTTDIFFKNLNMRFKLNAKKAFLINNK